MLLTEAWSARAQCRQPAKCVRLYPAHQGQRAHSRWQQQRVRSYAEVGTPLTPPLINSATEDEVEANATAEPAEPSPLAGGPDHDHGMHAATMGRSKAELWMAAVKPPMYSVGFVPVMVAAAAAFWDYGAVSLARSAGFALAAILIIAWLNLSNDAFDADTGVDRSKPESVVNLTGNRVGVLLTAKALLLAGGGLLAALLASTGDPRIGALLAFSIACGYIYQGPPFRLSYKGLGEPLCFIAFGPSATTAFYLALLPRAGQAPPLLAAPTPLVATLALLVGITTTVILFTSHWHQIQGDLANGKMSPLVRLGSTEKAMPILKASVAATYAISVAATLGGALPPTALLATALSLPAARSLLQFAQDNYTSVQGITFLKRYATKWHIVYGLCLVLGLAGGRTALPL